MPHKWLKVKNLETKRAMYRYKNVLVYLNAQDDEKSVLEMAGKITHLARSQRIIFNLGYEAKEMPAEVKEKYPWTMEPLGEAFEEKISKEIASYYRGFEETKCETKICEGHSIYKLLEIAHDASIDLVIVGANSINGDLPARLARKAPCSVMIVPDDAKADFDGVLVTVDFSKFSEHSIDVATAFAQAQGLSKVYALHVSLLPEGRNKGILPENDYRRLNEPFFKDKLDTFLEPLEKYGVEVEANVSHAYAIEHAVSQYLDENNISLIITGCRGKDALSALLLGSNAESIIKAAKVPVIAVKEKGTGESFIENLLGLVAIK